MAQGSFRLNKTLWHDGAECVGLRESYVVDGINKVVILAKDKEGRLKHNGVWTILGSDIRQWDLKAYGNMPPQYFVPIDALRKVRQETPLTPYGY